MNLGDLGSKYDGLCDRLDKLTVAVERLAVQNDQLHSVAYREWEPYREAFGNVTDSSKNLTLRHRVLKNGWEGYIDRIAVSVSGASSSTTVAVFVGNESSDLNLVDWASALYGNSPSRIVADYNSPIYIRDDEQLCLVFTGSADVGDNVAVRVEGRRRQV